MVLGVGIVAAGTPARGTVVPDASEILDRLPSAVDPSTFPPITVEQDVQDWNHEIAGPGAQELLLTLAENLELENQALLAADTEILSAVDHGDRLAEMQGRLDEATSTGTTMVAHYQFDEVNVTLLEPFGVQTGLSLGLQATGTVTTETYVDGELQGTDTAPYQHTLRHAPGNRRSLAQRGRPAGHVTAQAAVCFQVSRPDQSADDPSEPSSRLSRWR